MQAGVQGGCRKGAGSVQEGCSEGTTEGLPVGAAKEGSREGVGRASAVPQAMAGRPGGGQQGLAGRVPGGVGCRGGVPGGGVQRTAARGWSCPAVGLGGRAGSGTLSDAPRHVTPICPATACASIAIAIATSAVNTGIVWTVLRRVRGGGA